MTTHSARDAYRLALLLAGLSAIGPFSFDTFLPAMPTIAQSLHVGPIEIQQALTVYMLSFGVMTLWHGTLSDTLGRRPVILACMLLFTVASFGCAMANSLSALLTWRAIQGLVGGAGMIVGRAIIRDRFDGIEAQRMMSQVTMLFALAPAVAPVIGGWLFAAFNWHAIFIFMGLFSLLLFVTCWFTLAETHPQHKRTPLAPRMLFNNYVHIGRTSSFGLMSAAVAFNFAGFFIYIPSTPVFLIQHLGLSAQQFGYMFAPTVGGIMLGSWLSGRMAGRRGAHETIRIGYVLMFTAVSFNLGYSLFFLPSLVPSVLPLVMYTTGMSLAAPSMTIILMDQFPHLRGTASSLQGFSQSMLNAAVAGAVAPLVWGQMQTLALSMAVFLLLGFGCYLRYRRWIVCHPSQPAGR